MSRFSLSIVAADKIFYNGKCHSIVVPALDGEVQIMAHHEEMVIATQEGEVRFRVEENAPWRYAVMGIGFVHVSHNRVTMLTDTAERPEDIDRVRAEQAMERAKEQLRQKQSIQEYRISKASLVRATLRLKEAGKWQGNS